jgi:hypothetical protein
MSLNLILNSAEAEAIEIMNKAASTDEIGEAPEGVDPVLWEQWKQWEMLPTNDFLYQVKRGMQGLNTGLRSGIPGLDKYTYGIHQARYYLIGADSSVGKTTVADFMFVFNAWKDAKRLGRPIKIFYCSFEVGKMDKTARWVSHIIFQKWGIRLPSDYILGRIEGKRVTKAHEALILKAYALVLEMMKDIVFVEDVIHPTKIFEDLIGAHFEKVGIVTRAEVSEEDRAKGRKGYVKGYQPNDPNLITFLVIDHLALTGSEQKLDTKHIMDRMSKYGIVLRNIFHCTTCFIQQFSTDLMSFHRTNKKNPQSIAPQRLDFGDSKATFRDADLVFGLVNPASYDFDKFHGYTLMSDDGENLGECFRGLYLMKNRYGISSRLIPLFLDGLSGTVYDLPIEGSNVIAMTPWYNKATEIEALCQEFSPSQKRQ